MNKFVATIFTFILLTQVASYSFNQITPQIDWEEPLQGDSTWEVSGRNNTTGGNNTGGNNSSNNTGGCGTNASNVWFEVEPYKPEWNASDTVSVYLDTYCGIWNNLYMVSWGLIDNATNSIIDYGNTSFVTNTSSVSYHPNHTYHFNQFDIHLHYMETGNYTVFGQFSVWMNNSWTFLSNESSTFEVNSTMTTTVCGFNSTFIDIETDMQSTFYFADSSVHPWSDIECPMLNTPYTYTWEMYNLNTSTVTHSGLQNFTATWQNVNMFLDGSGFFYDLYPHAYNITEGTYLLNTTLLSASGDSVDTSNVSFSVWANPWNNTGACGNETSLTDLWASTDSSTWGTWTNAVYGYYDVNCTIPGKSYTLEATIYESTGAYQSYSFWNWTETNDHEYMSEAWSNLSAGSYCVNATLWEVSGGASNYVDSDYPCFTLSSNNTGGNNTGGNNTGGNNTGGNNTGGNNTGGNNTGGNNTGGNNTGGNNTGGNNTGGNNTGGNNTGGNNTSNNTCGNYSALPIHDSTISANSDYYIYDLSDTFYGTLIATCPMDDGRYMEVDYWITVNDYGLQTSTQNIGWDSYSSATETFTIVDSSISNYGEGSYTLHAEYYTWSNSQSLIFLDSDSSDFYIIDNSTNTGNNTTSSASLEVGLSHLWFAGSYDTEQYLKVESGVSGSTYEVVWTLETCNGVQWADGGTWTFTAPGGGDVYDISIQPGWNCLVLEGELFENGNYVDSDTDSVWCNCSNGYNTTSNSPPEITSVVISPSSPLDTDTLVCSYVFSDADNDPDNSLFTWTINGVPATSTSTILDSGYSDGDFVTCAVLAYDGIDTGNIGTSTVLVDSNATGGSSSGGLPSIGVIGTLAAIAVSFVAVIRREKEE